MYTPEARAAVEEALRQISKVLTCHLSKQKGDEEDKIIGALAVAAGEAVGTAAGDIGLILDVRDQNRT